MNTKSIIAIVLFAMSGSAFAMDGYSIKVGRDYQVTANTALLRRSPLANMSAPTSTPAVFKWKPPMSALTATIKWMLKQALSPQWVLAKTFQLALMSAAYNKAVNLKHCFCQPMGADGIKNTMAPGFGFIIGNRQRCFIIPTLLRTSLYTSI